MIKLAYLDVMQSMSVLSLGAFFFMANKAETKSLAHLTSVIKGTLWSMAIRRVLKKKIQQIWKVFKNLVQKIPNGLVFSEVMGPDPYPHLLVFPRFYL